MVEAVVAIPVRNEEDRIGACLHALAGQVGLGCGALGVVLLVNNTTDGTLSAVASARPALPHALHVAICDSPEANAGWARRGALEIGAGLLEGCGRGGALLTTDADSRVPPDWVVRNLAALARGADEVAGRVDLDPVDAACLSPELQARGRLEAEYHALLDELAATIDPDPNDPWPNHSVESGASLAVTLAAYRNVGGLPPVALGDDRAFVARLREGGFRIRHDPAICVATSGRLVGRAAGGVADAMRARQKDPDSPCESGWRLSRWPCSDCAGADAFGSSTTAGSSETGVGFGSSVSLVTSWRSRRSRPLTSSRSPNDAPVDFARLLFDRASLASISVPRVNTWLFDEAIRKFISPKQSAETQRVAVSHFSPRTVRVNGQASRRRIGERAPGRRNHVARTAIDT